ncbi:MAG TPA: hypothetical protein PKK60_03770 [archaeon]|nr:hypothetical protein [archaeon]
MDFKGFIRGFIEGKQVLLILFFGLIGFLAPMGSIFVTEIKGQQFFVQFNSTLLMILSLLIMVFFIIKLFDYLFNRDNKYLAITILILLLILFSFLYHLMIFISI